MDSTSLYKKILLSLSLEVPKTHLLTWFKDSGIIAHENGILKIAVPIPIAKEWITSHYLAKLREIAKNIDPEIHDVEIIVEGSFSYENPLKIDINELFDEKKTRKLPKKCEVKISENGNVYISKVFNPKYTLNNFIVSKDNHLVHAVCLAVSRKPAGEYNPLFIYGGVGLGKTHLLQATGNEILKNFPEKKVIYLTAENFVNEVVEAIKKYKMDDLKNKYRKIDCLVVDDIQFFAEKERSQEEFFHTFNALYDSGKQLILSSDRPPKELAGIEARLKSRFESGMVAEVYFPDYETRIAILQRKCQDQQAILPPQILEFIAANTHDNVRELEGILTNVIAEMRLTNSIPTMRSIAMHLQKLDKNGKINGIEEKLLASKLHIRSPEELIRIISSYYSIPYETVVSPVRKKEVLIARQVSMFLIYEIFKYSFDTVGSLFGDRNHTTVIHAYRKIKDRLQSDQKLVADVNAIKTTVGL